MKYKVIIPTFERPETLVKKTLSTISKTNLDTSDMHIFFASSEQQDKYIKYDPRLQDIATLHVGVRGLPNQHNLIQNMFREGEHLFILDDDVSRIDIFDGVKAVALENLHEFVIRAFEVTEALGMKMWGANANIDPRNMQNKISVGLIYLVQNMFGIINNGIRVDTGDMIPLRKSFAAGKESHERVLKYYVQHGAVVKFKNVGARGQYWTEPGGLAVSRTDEGEEEASRILIAKYPGLVRFREFNGRPDLEFVGGKTVTYDIDVPLETLRNKPKQNTVNDFFNLGI